MPVADLSLAIETSGRAGTIALGRGAALLATAALPQVRRHNIELTPTIAALFRAHDLQPCELGEVYVSLGPGSFTGLRIGIATAKMLAIAGGVKLVGVPTMEVLLAGVAETQQQGQSGAAQANLAICMNAKRGSVYSGVFSHGTGGWREVAPRRLRTWEALLAEVPRPLALLAEKPPDEIERLTEEDDELNLLPREMTFAKAAHVWQIGRRTAAEGQYTDAHRLLPLYIRQPEAVTLWEARQK